MAENNEKRKMEEEYKNMEQEQKKPNKVLGFIGKWMPWVLAIAAGGVGTYFAGKGASRGAARTIQDKETLIQSLLTNVEEETVRADNLAEQVSKLASERDMLRSIMNQNAVNTMAKTAEEFTEKINF